MTYLIGADPEFFVEHEGTILPAVNMVEGTKYDPFACMNGAMQVDGVALEFNIDPASSEDEFVENIISVRDQTLNAAVERTGRMLTISKKVFHDFTLPVLRELPRENTILGCEPDYDSNGIKRSTSESVARGMRCTGGHIHIGYGENLSTEEDSADFFDACAVARFMSKIVEQHYNIMMWQKLLNEPQGRDKIVSYFESENNRKMLYGHDGAFRPKSYGLEYRGMSSHWINSEETIRWVYRRTQLVMQLLDEGMHLDEKLSHLLDHAAPYTPHHIYDLTYHSDMCYSRVVSYNDTLKQIDERLAIF
jgi:hypothetical protein